MLPGIPDRPLGSRPSFPQGIDRPTTLPGRLPGGSDRPIFNRPGDSWNVGNINLGNNSTINNRPSWVNINQNSLVNINSRWQGQINGLYGWTDRYPGRLNYWHNWGSGIRNAWWPGRYYGGHWFDDHWWHGHHHYWCGWHYGYWFNRYPWTYWWTYPTYVDLSSWFAWSAPAAVWSQPVYYDYGPGGNVTYENNIVYINGEQVASADEFSQSAMSLATVPPPADDEQAAQAEWMPLGTFAVSTSDKDAQPTRMIQLAVNRQGIVSGTLFNMQTDQAQSIQGQVDKETQRVAFRIGENERVVVETGLYNLTQQEAPVLVHFGTDRVENWLLVRLEAPPESGTAGEKITPRAAPQ